jgi:hypothetical protein
MSKHTPGPWVLDDDEWSPVHALLGVYVAGDRGGRIAKSFANCLVTTDEACRANARLIATAPDLLQFVKDWLADFTAAGPTDSPREAEARALIAKAERQ